MILHWPWWYYCIGCLLAGITAYLLDWLFIIRPLRRDRDRWRRKAEEWRKRATYMVEKKVPGETREETCIRLTEDALWKAPEDWKYKEAIRAADEATGGDA